MIENNLIEFASRESNADPLTELLRQGARQLIAQAVEAELAVFMSTFAERQCPNGRAAVVRNGYQPERQIQTGIGAVSVQIPKVRVWIKTSGCICGWMGSTAAYVQKTPSCVRWW